LFVLLIFSQYGQRPVTANAQTTARRIEQPQFSNYPGVPGATTQARPRYRAEDVRYQNQKIGLAALLLLPDSDKRVPGAVILQGSGASDRTNQWARAISDELVRKGIAVLLTDKRGSGKSEGNWQTSDFSDLAADAIAGVEYLRQRKEIDSERVGLVGLSQGGWVAPLAAAKSEQVAFVISVSAASVSFAEQTFTEMGNTARQAGLSEKQVHEVLELNRAAAAYATTGNWANYAKLREEALKSPWSKIAEGFPGSPDLPIWTFLRGVGGYDPIPYWIQVTEPTLILYGEKDEQDNVPVAESVRRLNHAFGLLGKQNYRIVVIPNAGHSFIDPQQRQLMPAFVEAMTSWVEEKVLR
jgi:pimeloyl-ACP methyl ester carboxylesterase